MTTPVGAQAAALGPRRRSPCLATAADASARLRKCPAEAGLVEDMVQACRTSRPTKRDATETRDRSGKPTEPTASGGIGFCVGNPTVGLGRECPPSLPRRYYLGDRWPACADEMPLSVCFIWCLLIWERPRWAERYHWARVCQPQPPTTPRDILATTSKNKRAPPVLHHPSAGRGHCPRHQAPA